MNGNGYHGGNGQAEQIRVLQRMLRATAVQRGNADIFVTETGVYDDRTRDAVRIYQKEVGIPQTGRVDLNTWTLLRAEYEAYRRNTREPGMIRPFSDPRRRIRFGERSDLVMIVQIILNALRLRYDELGAIPLSGLYDELTENAVREFQRINLLDSTGETDLNTWNRLASEYNYIVEDNQ